MKRKIIAYKGIFNVFYKAQDEKTQEKIEYALDLIRWEKTIPGKYFKHLSNTDGIYEIRIRTVFKNIRILCFFEKDVLIILCNCFIKKSQKTPPKEIRRAERLKKRILR